MHAGNCDLVKVQISMGNKPRFPHDAYSGQPLVTSTSYHEVGRSQIGIHERNMARKARTSWSSRVWREGMSHMSSRHISIVALPESVRESHVHMATSFHMFSKHMDNKLSMRVVTVPADTTKSSLN